MKVYKTRFKNVSLDILLRNSPLPILNNERLSVNMLNGIILERNRLIISLTTLNT